MFIKHKQKLAVRNKINSILCVTTDMSYCWCRHLKRGSGTYLLWIDNSFFPPYCVLFFSSVCVCETCRMAMKLFPVYLILWTNVLHLWASQSGWYHLTSQKYSFTHILFLYAHPPTHFNIVLLSSALAVIKFNIFVQCVQSRPLLLPFLKLTWIVQK